MLGEVVAFYITRQHSTKLIFGCSKIMGVEIYYKLDKHSLLLFSD